MKHQEQRVCKSRLKVRREAEEARRVAQMKADEEQKKKARALVEMQKAQQQPDWNIKCS